MLDFYQLTKHYKDFLTKNRELVYELPGKLQIYRKDPSGMGYIYLNHTLIADEPTWYCHYNILDSTLISRYDLVRASEGTLTFPRDRYLNYIISNLALCIEKSKPIQEDLQRHYKGMSSHYGIHTEFDHVGITLAGRACGIFRKD
jgi:hypothetical protein